MADEKYISRIKLSLVNVKGNNYIKPYTMRSFFLGIIRAEDKELAHTLHDTQERRPYSIQFKVIKEYNTKRVQLVVNLFKGGIFETLIEHILKKDSNLEVTLEGDKYMLIRIDVERKLFKDLHEERRPIKQFQLDFKKPTYFKSLGYNYNIKLPLPGSIVKNLVYLWNEFTDDDLVIEV
ncbi:MAG: hypothetical protein ACTSXP_13685, partial [Promethearchaeota archaeon]